MLHIHDEIEELVNGADPIVDPDTEVVTADEFQEIEEFLEGTRNCTVGGLVYNNEGELLLLRHAGEPGWLQPGGMVEKGESLETALRREIREETGVEAVIEEPFLIRRGEYVHRRYEADATGLDAEGNKITWYSTLFFAEAIEPSIGDELGVEDEEIVDAQWFSELPDQLHQLASRERFRQVIQEVDSRLSET